MGLVAIVAGRAAGVLGGGHLRKALRFGRVLLVALVAQLGDFGQFGNVRRRIVGVLRQWTVARFAGHASVFAGGAGLAFVVVTHQAGFLPGKGYGMLADQVQRARPVVPILPEGLGNDGATHNQENCHCGQQDHGRPKQMNGIVEQAAHSSNTFPGRVFTRPTKDFGGNQAIMVPKGLFSIYKEYVGLCNT